MAESSTQSVSEGCGAPSDPTRRCIGHRAFNYLLLLKQISKLILTKINIATDDLFDTFIENI